MKRGSIIFVILIFFFIFLISINALSIGGKDDAFHNGAIDEVRIYNQSLSSDEVKSNYELGYVNWGEWQKGGLIKDMISIRTSSIINFIQYKFLLETNDTQVSPRVLNYSVESIGSNLLPSTLLVKINSTLGNNYTDENLQCYVNITDLDDTNVYANFTWYNDTSSVFSGQYGPFSRNTLTLISTLNSANTTKYQNWTCSVKAYDGTDYEEDWTNSSSLKILNKPPEVSLNFPLDDTSTTNRTPKFNWTGTDADGDTITYELNISCYHNAGGTCSSDDRNFKALTKDNKTLTESLKYLWDNQYYYNWTVRANDSEEYGNWALPVRRLKIISCISTSLLVDFIDFGEMINGTNSTDNDNPGPFELQNDGNCLVNTTINASDLWISEPNPSQYYQYKIDNKTGEEGAFVWKWSNTSWSDLLSITSFAIAKLNWSDSRDVAEIDLKIEVPSQEVAGNKTSTVWFVSSLGE
jgi:hypothetical protein